MPLNFFRPKPGQFGTSDFTLTIGPLGPANYLGGASPITANTTTTLRVGAPPVKCRFKALMSSCSTVAADSDGTILAVANKQNGATTTAQTGNVDLEALVAKVGTLTQGTATEPNRIFNGTTDTLEIVITNNSAAIDTQPAGLVFVALFERIN